MLPLFLQITIISLTIITLIIVALAIYINIQKRKLDIKYTMHTLELAIKKKEGNFNEEDETNNLIKIMQKDEKKLLLVSLITGIISIITIPILVTLYTLYGSEIVINNQFKQHVFIIVLIICGLTLIYSIYNQIKLNKKYKEEDFKFAKKISIEQGIAVNEALDIIQEEEQKITKMFNLDTKNILLKYCFPIFLIITSLYLALTLLH